MSDLGSVEFDRANDSADFSGTTAERRPDHERLPPAEGGQRLDFRFFRNEMGCRCRLIDPDTQQRGLRPDHQSHRLVSAAGMPV
jgi:hypothetical protein